MLPRLLLAALLTALLVTPSARAATTYCVGVSCEGTPKASIDAALAAAATSPGKDLIMLGAGPYAGAWTIPAANPVDIVGLGKRLRGKRADPYRCEHRGRQLAALTRGFGDGAGDVEYVVGFVGVLHHQRGEPAALGVEEERDRLVAQRLVGGEVDHRQRRAGAVDRIAAGARHGSGCTHGNSLGEARGGGLGRGGSRHGSP